MRYDGPPGMMLDLVPASPDGVDLEWVHPYTDAQPYVYAKNNPVVATDPGGLAPKKQPNAKPQFPKGECVLQLCCGQLNPADITGTLICKTGPYQGQFVCHCFVRLVGATTFQEYHGTATPLNKWTKRCCWGPFNPKGPELTCVTGAQAAAMFGTATMPGPKDCVALTYGDCNILKRCLTREFTKCKARTLCYGECGWPNSNTIAFEFASACGGVGPPNLPPMQGTGCPAAPGYGPLFPPLTL